MFVNMPAKDRGFTLIELIMVIVILGILSAFALPKFADFSSDAESSSIEGARGSVRSASAITHAACLADSNCNSNLATGQTVELEGEEVSMAFGYPSYNDLVEVAGLTDYYVNVSDATNNRAVISLEETAGSPCFTYTSAANSGAAPVISESFVADSDLSTNGLGAGGDNNLGTSDDTCN